MEEFKKIKKNLSFEKIIEDFDKDGIKLSKKDAEDYLKTIYFLAKLVVQQHII